MSSAIQQTSPKPVASWRIAIIDDVYAGPCLEAVKEWLPEFCAEVSDDEELAQLLTQRTQCDFATQTAVTNDGIVALFNCREQLPDFANRLDKLFLDFDQRKGELVTIEENLKAHGFPAENIRTFPNMKDVFSGEPFQLVLLDLVLAKGDPDSREIAKEIYEKFQAFILLMSNSPVAKPQIEGFRRDTKLLNGFFEFRAKSELCDKNQFRVQIASLPKDAEVCHAIHNFVIAIEQALGSPITEPPINVGDSPAADGAGPVLRQFMHTLRALGLHDYALLCELTLRNEGHPLGDYMMRLLGSHLLAQLLSNSGVKNAVAALDKLRFTEFLPFRDEESPSFHRMYADATTEVITAPWAPHPWSVATAAAPAEPQPEQAATSEAAEVGADVPAAGEAAPASQDEGASEILNLLNIKDNDRDLPYMQLGDLLIKDEKSLVFAVLSAACELQFVPAHVQKGHERLRDETVLLVPGRLRPVGKPNEKDAQTTAGFVEWQGTAYCIDWFGSKLLGVPHCALRPMLEDRGYLHVQRLQTARALELQQAVLSKLSRIGLEVRPPFPRDIKITLYGRQADQSFKKLGDPVAQGGLLFHGRTPQERVLVLRRSAFFTFADEMKKHSYSVVADAGTDAKLKTILPAAVAAFTEAMGGLKLPIEISNSQEPRAVQLVDSSGKKQSLKPIALRFGGSAEITAINSKEIMFCLSAEEE